MATSDLIRAMAEAARKAGDGLRRDFDEVGRLRVSTKGPSDFVSQADLKAEETLFAELSKARPGYGFLMEERGRVDGAERSHRWIVDPLDGTTNFLHGIPLFSIAIGLEREGELIAGLVFNPATDELYAAERGRGASLNGRPLRVSARETLTDCVLSTGVPHRGRPHHGRFLRELEACMREAAGIRRTGSAALDLAWVAAGRFDAYWEHGLSPWDVAAGAVLVREAGGVVSDLDGGERMFETRDVCAGNPLVQPALRGLVSAARGEWRP